MYFIKYKKYTQNPEWKWPQKVTAVPRPQQARTRGQLVVYRTDSGQEARNRRTSSLLLLPRKIRLPLLLLNTAEDPPTTITTKCLGRSAFFYFFNSFYHYLCYGYNLHLQNWKLQEVSFQELIISYKEYPLPQPHIHYIVVTKDNIIVLEPLNL